MVNVVTVVNNAPYIRQRASVTTVMLKVLVALAPGLAAYVWFFGAGILVNLLIATAAALAGEALVLRLRRRPTKPFLTDLSAVVTAWLIALSFPPTAPWWLLVVGTLIAIVVGKQLYGGLGQNPFNPAMLAYCAMIVAFPALMSQWPGAGQLDFSTQLQLIFGGERVVDAITTATPLDALRTGLRQGHDVMHTLGTEAVPGVYGLLGGHGWEWVALGYLVGGLWLWQQRIISWHLPAGFIVTLALVAGAAHLIDPAACASPLFHLASGGAMLGAFFIITDPVSSASTPRGKLIFAAGVALITWLIRTFGAYPDGVAFGVLLMNILVPLIDMWTQPPVFGHKDGNADHHHNKGAK